MLFLLRFICILTIGCPTAWSATINSISSNYTDVTNAIGQASASGDTVVVPAGTSEWGTTVISTKAIKLQGNGTNTTIIKRGHGGYILDFALVANQTSQITGFQFTTGTVQTGSGVIHVQGVNTDARRMRIDHCYFLNDAAGTYFIDSALGVMDHCRIMTQLAGFGGYVKNNSWGFTQGVNNYGDGAWTNGLKFGTEYFWFFEDCEFTNTWPTLLTCFDSQAGGRYVIRNCTIGNGSIETHGIEASRERSGHAFEVYSNNFVGNGSSATVTYLRGGSGVIHDNNVSGYGAATLFLVENRVHDAVSPPHGGSDGRNPWDVNDAGNPIVSGTCSSSGTFTMTDSGKSWTTDQYIGYILRRTSGKSITSMTRSGGTVSCTCTAHGYTTNSLISIWGANESAYNNIVGSTTNNGATANDDLRLTITDANHFTFHINWTPASPATGTILTAPGGYFSDITGNTSTQLTFRDSVFGINYRVVFTASDTYEINKVTFGIDEVGRTGGSLLSGDTPSIPGGWNDQTTAPWYEWRNTNLTGVADINFSTVEKTIINGLHYTNDTVLSDYTAYVYPHPMVSGIAPPPSGNDPHNPVKSGASSVGSFRR